MGMREVLAVIIVAGFVITNGFLVIFPFFSSIDVTIDKYLQYLGFASSIYAGLVGIIIGYYFGRHSVDNQSIAAGANPSGNNS